MADHPGVRITGSAPDVRHIWDRLRTDYPDALARDFTFTVNGRQAVLEVRAVDPDIITSAPVVRLFDVRVVVDAD